MRYADQMREKTIAALRADLMRYAREYETAIESGDSYVAIKRIEEHGKAVQRELRYLKADAHWPTIVEQREGV